MPKQALSSEAKHALNFQDSTLIAMAEYFLDRDDITESERLFGQNILDATRKRITNRTFIMENGTAYNGGGTVSSRAIAAMRVAKQESDAKVPTRK